MVIIPAGLAILALEFAWAKVWLDKVQETGCQMRDSLWSWYRRRRGRAADVTSGLPPALPHEQRRIRAGRRTSAP